MVELSVVIPTRDRAADLRRCLEGLLRQSLEAARFEVIVVDNGSIDDTVRVVAEFRTSASFTLRYVREELPGLHRGRHAGLRAAASELLVFADDDIVAEPRWLESILETLTSSDAALVGGRNLPLWEVPPPAWLAELWESRRRIGTLSILDLGDEMRTIDPNLVWGCNFAVRRWVVMEAGGFHPDAMPDGLLKFRGDGESHVSRHVAANSYMAVYHPAATVLHAVPSGRMTLEYFRRRAFAQGVSESFYQARCSGSDALPVGRSRWKEAAARVLRIKALDSALLRLLPWKLYFELTTGAAHRLGFTWHQHLCLRDAEVRAWVFRADYLDGTCER